jgi:hypothetical protein
MPRYWVIGGEYKTTDFRDMANDKGPQRFGPFETYDEAKAAWQAKSWANVDNCNYRYTIVKDDGVKDGAASAA